LDQEVIKSSKHKNNNEIEGPLELICMVIIEEELSNEALGKYLTEEK